MKHGTISVRAAVTQPFNIEPNLILCDFRQVDTLRNYNRVFVPSGAFCAAGNGREVTMLCSFCKKIAT